MTALAGVPLFAGFTKRHLARLARETDELGFSPGERIVEEGMLGETLYVVLSGRAKVTRAGRKVGEVLPGDFFGEALGARRGSEDRDRGRRHAR